MPTYDVTFIKYHIYTVEAEDELKAQDKAYRKFVSDMRSPIADTSCDDVEVEEVE